MLRWIVIGGLVLTLGLGALGAAAWTVASWAAPVVASAVTAGLGVARAQLPHVLPATWTHADLHRLLDGAQQALREGHVDGAALRDLAWWLPLALLDGGLDAHEAVALHGRLTRVVSRAPPADPAAGGGTW
jgi:hypothetical protein